jgi:head-tail adaptor
MPGLDRRDMAAELVAGERIQSRSAWMITLPAGTDVTAKDRISVGSRTFQVLGVLSGSMRRIGASSARR